ncbi:HotDog domain-containing protein [Xylogone sp. PMI_703]|nr:HotDog domain-containing protein [Xylogone sp. PMI_703]
MTKERYTTKHLLHPGVAFHPEISDPKQRVQAYLDTYRGESSHEGFDEALMRNALKLVNATGEPKVTVTFRMTVTPEFCSRMGNMHGGAISLVFDMCTTMCAAPVSRKDFWWFGGVSRTLNVTFLRPIKKGTEIEIFCELLHIGARLAAIRGEIRDASDGRLLAVAEHNKASIAFEEKGKL